jgi:hypothetical protein
MLDQPPAADSTSSALSLEPDDLIVVSTFFRLFYTGATSRFAEQVSAAPVSSQSRPEVRALACARPVTKKSASFFSGGATRLRFTLSKRDKDSASGDHTDSEQNPFSFRERRNRKAPQQVGAENRLPLPAIFMPNLLELPHPFAGSHLGKIDGQDQR